MHAFAQAEECDGRYDQRHWNKKIGTTTLKPAEDGRFESSGSVRSAVRCVA
jgi:hypothetical protein